MSEYKEFLVQRIFEGERFNSIMDGNELIHYIDMSDCHNEQWRIYSIDEFGVVAPIHYVGWQPDCLIEFANDNGEIVLSGYGIDH